jgi:glycosyltransferase involved in cell wall biosynthesis
MRLETADEARMILYVGEASTGGIAEYAVHQVNALAHAGAEVSVLCRPDFPQNRIVGAQVLPDLPVRSSGKGALRRGLDYISDARAISRRIVEVAASGGHTYVLLDSFREYLAPLWTGPLRCSARTGIKFGVIAHDPIRDFVLGPLWWHRFCIRNAYRFISDVFVHGPGEVDFGGQAPEGVRIHRIPHGPFVYPPPRLNRIEARKRYGFGSDNIVFLSFGQIRDGKNLDCFIEAMADLPDRVKLLVAGSGGARSQKPPEHYVELARKSGVGDRCKWDQRYIPDEAVAEIFSAADAVLMTYSQKFVSASGVLNTAVQFGKPVLVSAGEGPLKQAVIDYDIGEWMEGADKVSIVDGVNRMLRAMEAYSFDNYIRDHSWEVNARTVIEAEYFHKRAQANLLSV